MVGKIIRFPFWVICRIAGLISLVLKLIFGLLSGVFRFLFNHIIGTLLGATVGFVLGRKHVGVKLFTHKKKKPQKKAS